MGLEGALGGLLKAAPPKMIAAALAEKMSDAQLKEFDSAWREATEARKRKADIVYNEVLHCVTLAQQLKGQRSKKEVDDALDYLSGQGRIYSTIDGDHFRTMTTGSKV